MPVWPRQEDFSDFDSYDAVAVHCQEEIDTQNMTGTTSTTANGLVSRLIKLNVLSEMTGYARNRRFRYAPYIALFNDMGPGEDAPQGGI